MGHHSSLDTAQHLAQNCAEPIPVCSSVKIVKNEVPVLGIWMLPKSPEGQSTTVTVDVEHVSKKRALDVFTGTGSVRKVLEYAG